MPSSRIALTATGLTLSAGWVPAEKPFALFLRHLVKESFGHLAATGIVHADKQYFSHSGPPKRKALNRVCPSILRI